MATYFGTQKRENGRECKRQDGGDGMLSISILKATKLHVLLDFYIFNSKVVGKYENDHEEYVLLLKLRTSISTFNLLSMIKSIDRLSIFHQFF